MTYTLSWQETDLARERIAAVVGDSAAAALLPAVAPIQEPIVPAGGTPRPRARSLPPPGAREHRPLREARIADRSSFDDLRPGSNNWVVAPSRSASGHALLAGDPHLDLSLPSIWYEAELRSDEGLEIYGVTIPGEPAVIIGLTPGVGWSFTNSEGDFVDHYAEEVDDVAHPRQHLVDGRWWPVVSRVEAFRDRNGDTIAVDTFYWSRRGPLTWNGAEWRSIRWTALEVTDPLGPFLKLQRTRSVADVVAAIGTLQAPAQNVVMAGEGSLHLPGLVLPAFG
jgi:penicillin amidase